MIDFDHDLSHEDSCHEDCIAFVFAQDSHVLHNDDGVVVDGVHSVAHDCPIDFPFSFFPKYALALRVLTSIW